MYFGAPGADISVCGPICVKVLAVARTCGVPLLTVTVLTCALNP